MGEHVKIGRFKTPMTGTEYVGFKFSIGKPLNPALIKRDYSDCRKLKPVDFNGCIGFDK